MTSQHRLVGSALLFGLLWTGGMIYWTGTGTANIIILAVSGVVVSVFWYFAMKYWFTRRG